jgi:hypothetical protein
LQRSGAFIPDARLGQRRRANHAVDAAEHAVNDIHDRIQVAEHAAQPARERFEHLMTHARNLTERAEPSLLIEQLEQMQLRPIEQLIDAIDTCAAYALS